MTRTTGWACRHPLLAAAPGPGQEGNHPAGRSKREGKRRVSHHVVVIDLQPEHGTTFGDVFAVTEFRGLWSAQLLSIIGDQQARVALTVLVYHQTP